TGHGHRTAGRPQDQRIAGRRPARASGWTGRHHRCHWRRSGTGWRPMTQSPARSSGGSAAPRSRTGMKRGMLTSVTVGGLFAVYCLYAAVVGPLTRPQVLTEEYRGPAVAPEIKPLSIAGKIAGQHLAEHDWVSSAKYQLQRGEETFIYF